MESIKIHVFHIFTVCSKRNKDGSYWKVAKYRNKETGETISCTGIDLPEIKKMEYILTGKFVTNSYGKTFAVEDFNMPLPTTLKGFTKFLSSLKVGIGVGRAKLIYEAFGESVWDIIENEPQRLTEVGISLSSIERLSAKLSANKLEKKLFEFLSSACDISKGKIKGIINEYGDNAYAIIRKNPYELCKLSFSFKTADKLAMKLELPLDYKERIQAAARYVLVEAGSKGHSCLPKEAFVKALETETNQEFQHIKESVNDMFIKNDLKCTSGMIYRHSKYEQEVHISSSLKKLLERGKEMYPTLDCLIEEYEAKEGITFAEKQKEAIKTAIENQVSIITGGARNRKEYCNKMYFVLS